MTSDDTLKRKTDGKLFRVKILGHWSEIVASDGEMDVVKYYGDGYVSASKGFTYQVQERRVCQVTHDHWEGPMICGNPLPCPRHGGSGY